MKSCSESLGESPKAAPIAAFLQTSGILNKISSHLHGLLM
jgi:hypothetical protein